MVNVPFGIGSSVYCTHIPRRFGNLPTKYCQYTVLLKGLGKSIIHTNVSFSTKNGFAVTSLNVIDGAFIPPKAAENDCRFKECWILFAACNAVGCAGGVITEDPVAECKIDALAVATGVFSAALSKCGFRILALPGGGGDADTSVLEDKAKGTRIVVNTRYFDNTD
jgi:hypothetical protein